MIARAARRALGRWADEVAPAVSRILASVPLLATDADALAHALAATFVGLELYARADPDRADAATAALARLGALASLLDVPGTGGVRTGGVGTDGVRTDGFRTDGFRTDEPPQSQPLR